MLDANEAWEKYLPWNGALADELFPWEMAGVPVYLDLETDVLERVAERVGQPKENAQDGLIKSVLATLDFGVAHHRLFDEYLLRIERWELDQTLDEPPSIGLLALFSLGAENMHSGDGLAAHNFYHRLGQVAGLSTEQVERIQKSYTFRSNGVPNSERLWGSLNEWLELLEGNRGIATAYSLSHVHIGLPMSQALVRRADRERFGDMFAAFHLAPRSSMSPYDMARFLDEWMAREGCSASGLLRELWRDGSGTQERISDVACQCLQVWEGLGDTRSSGRQGGPLGRIRLAGSVATFPKKKLQLSLLANWGGAIPRQPLQVLSDKGETIGSLDFLPLAQGWIGLASEDVLDLGTVLSGELILEAPDGEGRMRREPRRLIPMRRDDLLQTFMEVDRIQLGEDSMVLCLRDYASVVNDFLQKTARPGFRLLEEFSGLPIGWALFTNVQILTSIPTERFEGRKADLNMLQPAATSQLVLQGGLSLPGNLRMWASGDPPEIRATADTDQGVRVVIRCVRLLSRHEPSSREKFSVLPALAWDLKAEVLPDGDYEITVFEERSSKPLRRETLRLRSAENPALSLNADREPLLHDFGASDSIVSARAVKATDFARGAWSTAPLTNLKLPEANPGMPKWFSIRSKVGSTEERKLSQVRIPRVETGSCRMTGEHYWKLETSMPGRAPRLNEGLCTRCGMVRYFLNYPRRAGSVAGRTQADLAPRFDVASIPAIDESHEVNSDLGFDALCQVSRGSIGAFERIALQVEPTRLFVDTYLRNLEALGHIEVERDLTTFNPTSWEVVNPTFSGMPEGSFALVGFRSESILTRLEEVVDAMGGRIVTSTMEFAPVRIVIADLDVESVEVIAADLSEHFHRDFRVVVDAAERIAIRLPPLSYLRHSLPRVSPMSGTDLRRWDPFVARFKPAGDISKTGAYRVGGFGRRYLYRNEEDLEVMTARLGDARIVKYLVAQDENLPLAGYDQDAEIVWAPQGAELPGLYGRVACLASGSLPKRDEEQDLITYTRIPPTLGFTLTNLLMS